MFRDFDNCTNCGEPLSDEFVEGVVYELDEIPDNEMNNSGKLEVVDKEGTLALVHDGQVLEFEHSHIRCTDVKYLTDDGEVVEEKP